MTVTFEPEFYEKDRTAKKQLEAFFNDPQISQKLVMAVDEIFPKESVGSGSAKPMLLLEFKDFRDGTEHGDPINLCKTIWVAAEYAQNKS